MKKIKVMSVFGTRPEAIKMCPLVKELQSRKEIESIVCVTGQHREMLKQVLDIFNVVPKYNLDIMRDKQSLTTITTGVLEKIEDVLEKEKPDIVLVHGDTSTSFSAALASFYKQIPVGHVEAGLRTYNIYSPFPEEMNRKLISQIAEMHFAPTLRNESNLKNESITKNVFVTGNTVMDAFKYTLKDNYRFKCDILNSIDYSKGRTILLTAHRRENLGKPLEEICTAVGKLIEKYEDIKVIYPVHLNPAVRETAHRILDKYDRAFLIDPVDVEDMHNVMSRSYLIMTDSGGLQEEGPHLGIPVVVLRTETERPEAVEAGTVVVAGNTLDDVFDSVSELLDDKVKYKTMSKAINPYGDGHASERICDCIINHFTEKTVNTED